jgi:L-ascorbate metabolism protein UlaG (beta-lactamase superfamily)
MPSFYLRAPLPSMTPSAKTSKVARERAREIKLERVRPEEIGFRAGELYVPGATGREPIEVRWLGTAGFAISHGGFTVLIDPYVTRAPLARCVLSKLASDGRAIDRHASRADAIVVGHTHFDHALDVPEIAKRTGATVFGSRSAATLCRAAGLPEARVRDVERAPGADPIVAEVGPFRLRFVPSAHSRFVLGRVPFPGDITDCDDVPMRAERYRCGAVFAVEITVAGKTIVHLGSAELARSDGFASREADLLLLCVAGWTSSANLPERVARALSPKNVVLSHWDDFFRPIDVPARVLPAIGFDRLVDRLTRATREARVGTLPLLGSLEL